MTSKPRTHFSSPLLGLILALYLCARILEITTTPVPRLAVIALDVLSALAFALVHGARQYGLRGILVFMAICVVVGNIVENIGVATGFPYGRYYFAGLMGPRLFHVPILLGVAYIGMAYVSWILARQIVVGPSISPAGTRLFSIPLVAAFIMVAWDLAQDPVWGTVLHGWVWLHGGPWFGVPVSNYCGWYGTVFLIYMLFALYLRRYPTPSAPHGRPFARLAILFYGFCALGNVLQIIPDPVPAFVLDRAGNTWPVSSIVAASALVSIFVMGAFALIAWIRLGDETAISRD